MKNEEWWANEQRSGEQPFRDLKNDPGLIFAGVLLGVVVILWTTLHGGFN